MALPVQVADVVIYALNWVYRHAAYMTAPTRREIESRFGARIEKLKRKGEGHEIAQRLTGALASFACRTSTSPKMKKETMLLSPLHSRR